MASRKLVIGNKNYSSWSLRGWLILKHLGIEFEEIHIALYSERYKAAIKRYSSAGKVPVYIDGDNTIWDSLAISEYLAEQYPHLWPADPNARATARSISAEMHSSFFALRDEMPMNCRATNRSVKLSAEANNDVSRIEDIWTSCRTAYGDGGPWLFGTFSIADVMYAPVASRFETYGLTLNDAATAYKNTVLSDPNIQQWYADSKNEKQVLQHVEFGR